ncbi:MAG: 1,4-dihydroxy-2-naphthoate octaprenyltransferase [Cryomorphaceae bacterium]|nr:1,4-dihydroxy-2-naphthoate octaprenyltransferase [Cryomorphaceae bacterium]
MGKHVAKHWVAAARLRTLPLAWSGIILGSLLAAANQQGSWTVFFLCMITATLFQVLSNFANDLGDGLKGTDANRTGEARMVGSGIISAGEMKIAVIITAGLSIVSAAALIAYTYPRLMDNAPLILGLLALASVIAALTYTLGKTPYGYLRLGEIMVFMFFGLVAVGGTYTVTVGRLDLVVLWAGSAIGLLSAAVLNLNNIRDIKNDLSSGKKTVANALGFRFARVYHYVLIILALDCVFVYNWLSNSGFTRNLFLLAIPPLLLHMLKVSKLDKPEDADPLLKELALTTLALAILLGLGHFWG